MSKLIWDDIGQKFYETGVQNGVLFPVSAAGGYPLGVAWNGLIGVSEKASGAEAKANYADNIKYLNLISAESFGATIEAYTYPNEFGLCDGSVSLSSGVVIGQQKRKGFGLCYRTSVGNDVDEDLGYKLHLIYGAMAAPTERAYKSVNDSPEAITFSWELTTTPVSVAGYRPTASLTIESTKVNAAALATLEGILYGSIGVDPRLPLPDEIAALFAAGAPAALAMSTIVPADAATAVVVTAKTVVMTFNNKILHEDIVVMTAAGVVVVGTKTWDATGKILTFTSTANWTAATTYLVALFGITDIYVQGLTPAIKKFTTA